MVFRALAFFIFAGIVLFSCLSSSFSKERKVAFRVINEISSEFEKKYGLTFSGVSESAPSGKYRNLGFMLDSKRVLEKDEGRKIVLEIATAFLDRINKDTELKHYLDVYPFDFSNITVEIFIMLPTGEEVYYPKFTIFSCYNNHVYFGFYRKSEDGNRSLLEHTSETIEEARQIVNQQQNTN